MSFDLFSFIFRKRFIIFRHVASRPVNVSKLGGPIILLTYPASYKHGSRIELTCLVGIRVDQKWCLYLFNYVI